MLRPAKMAKLTIVAPQSGLRPIVEKLHSLNSVHLVEFSEGRKGFEGFRIGKPLPEGQQAAERLVRLRSLGRHLDLGAHAPTTRHHARDVERNLDDHIHQLELNITSAADARARVAASVEALEKERSLVEPLAALPLRLEDYSGYNALATIVARTDDPAPAAQAVQDAVREAEVFHGGKVVAAFVPKAHAAKAAEVVARAGGAIVEAPRGHGTAQERLDAIGRELQQLQARLDAASQELARLRQQHADFLVAAEEHLSIAAEKADAPLAFATSDHAFVAECWVEESQVGMVQAALREAVGDKVHVEVTHPGGHHHHAHEAPAQSEEAAHGHEGEGSAEDVANTPPTAFHLAKPFRPFRMFTEMVSVPKYDEIDPTPVLGLVLPLFLGFMIGDAGYGLLMLVLGVWMIRTLSKGLPEAKDLGIALAAAGVVSLFFGAVVFTDAFGIPFGMHGPGTDVVTPAACASFVAHANELTWSCITGAQALNVHPMVAKLRDIGDLLIISVIAAFAHMGLGLVFGVANSAAHKNWKHVVGKLGWAVLMVGFFAQILYMAGPAYADPTICEPLQGNRIACATFGALGFPTSTFAIVGVDFHLFLLAGMVAAAVLLAVGEGPITVLELPTMLSNLMSYTRLAGLAIAKGAMAAAFTSLTLVAMVYGNDGGALGLVLVVVGLVLFLFTQAFVFVLGVFSSGIQAIRLNYVEFFQKFYAGGGIPFTPFGKQRKYTQEAP
jgi:V/A-type H+/Na+-transporting ATPase subunit I